MSYVFVYGTLRSGECNHSVIAHGRYVGAGYIRGEVIQKAYPALIDGTLKIPGEIYEVNDDLLYKLDWFEGVPSGLYVRKATTAYIDGANMMEVFAYYGGTILRN